MGSYSLFIRDIPRGERPRERLQTFGEGALSSAELIAILLRTGSGEESALRLADNLLAEFAGLTGIARASFSELTAIKGIGPAKASEIKAALEIGRRLLAESPAERPQISTPADAANLLMPSMSHLEQEHLRIILLDTRNRVLSIQTLYIGSLNRSVVRVGEIFRAAIKENAAGLIVVHNHPSGDPTPSPEDVHVTKEMIKAGKLLNIECVDHLVIGRNKFVSMKERNLGF